MTLNHANHGPRNARSRKARPAFRVIGFVGGVGSGKSYVTRETSGLLAGNGVSVTIIDGDVVGHETLAEPSVRDAVVARFGGDVLVAGEIDRRALGSRVLGEQADADALHDLEAIMHPRMRARFESTIVEADASDTVVLFDAAVLFEAGWNDLCDACVFVDVPPAQRLARATARGWTEQRWRSTEARQWPLSRKRAAVESLGPAGRVIDNGDGQSSPGRDVVTWLMSTSPATADQVDEPLPVAPQ